jgi:hypothetical protein
MRAGIEIFIPLPPIFAAERTAKAMRACSLLASAKVHVSMMLYLRRCTCIIESQAVIYLLPADLLHIVFSADGIFATIPRPAILLDSLFNRLLIIKALEAEFYSEICDQT